MKGILNSKYLSIIITLLLFVFAFIVGSVLYPGFGSMQVIMNILIDNAYLIVTAIGMTFVIFTGGIDLSVGSMIAFTSMILASLLEQNVNPALVIFLVLAIGSIIGLIMGFLIQYFKLQPFIVTLIGMFLMRGLCYLVSIQSISVTDPFFNKVAQTRIGFIGNSFMSVGVIIAFILLAIAMYLAHYTKFGRTIYAIGGNENSAELMGLPVARTKVLVYGFNGFCSALAGIVFTFYMLSGYPLAAQGVEMDAIASVVIGGTLLTGGSGFVFGTLFGVLIQGLIKVLLMFQGTLSSWWTSIFIGILLFIFIALQVLIVNRRKKQQELSKTISDDNKALNY